jgi:hypothetical protein
MNPGQFPELKRHTVLLWALVMDIPGTAALVGDFG